MAYYVQLFNLSERDAISDGDPNPRGENLAHLSIAFGCLAGFFVILRLLTRGFYNKRIGADDVLIAMAMILATCMVVTYNEEAANGFGLHETEIDSAHKIAAFKWFFAAQILYKVTTCLTKLSLGIMYFRIFPGRNLHIAVGVVMGICVAYTLAAVLLTVFACKPIRKSWDKELSGTCLQSRTIWYSTSVLNIITDVMIILLPINEIRRLQLPTIKKVLLCMLFSLGIFVIACTVVRMVTVSPQTTAEDQTYYQAVSNSWTFVETDVGIICASRPSAIFSPIRPISKPRVRAYHRDGTGLPILRVPITKSFRRFLGLSSRKDTSGTGNSNPAYILGTVGHVSTRGRVTSHVRLDDDDSVEELIYDGNNNNIKTTKTFSTHVSSRENSQTGHVEA